MASGVFAIKGLREHVQVQGLGVWLGPTWTSVLRLCSSIVPKTLNPKALCRSTIPDGMQTHLWHFYQGSSDVMGLGFSKMRGTFSKDVLGDM